MGISWARTPGERRDRAAQVILGMVAVGASDNILGRAKDASNVIYGYAEL